MRVANWNVEKDLQQINAQVWDNARGLMSGVVSGAKAKCPVLTEETKKYTQGRYGRNGGAIVFHAKGEQAGSFVKANVSFLPKSGRNKGKQVSFTAKAWTGRYPGQLRDSIRLVEKPGSGNLRVYAGNFKTYYARFVERGTRKMRAIPYLRPPFQLAKANTISALTKGL